ncbi:MAG: PAS domain S-box protein [Deltaproteobacteria bacterium]|nr:PAS domain S-box protein [Deltaproteobacteria bacterium]
MENISLKKVLFNIIKKPLLRRILLITIAAAIFFPAFSFYFIFPQFIKQLTNYSEDAAIRVATHLSDMILDDRTVLAKKIFAGEVEKKILKEMKDLGLEKIKVFSKSGKVLFSSNPEDVGKINTYDYFHNLVAQGKIYSQVIQKNTKTMEGRIVNLEVVESYVPLMSKGIFKGALEVYYNITGNKEVLTTLLDQLKITIVVFSLIFLVVIFVILFKASRNVIGKDIAEASLQRGHAQLEKKIAERTKDLNKTNKSLLIEIEEHRASDLALRESERRFRAILEANPDPMVMYDQKGHPQYINPAFTSLFGWTLKELKSRTIPFVPEDQKQLSADKIKEIYQYGGPLSFETKRFTRDNRILDVIISAAITEGMDGKPDGMVVNLTNISEKKALEAQYKQAQKMESIGTLAGGIAHDFNNILTGIFGYSQLAIVNLKNPEKAKDNIEQVLKGAKRAADLVQQILTFSRQSEYKKQALNVSALVKEALKLLRSSIPSTIEIKENIISRASVMADSTQIHQVVMNLCTNAYQAMNETGGILTVGLEEIEVPGPDNIPELNMASGKYLRLEVTDTGHGIDPETMDKIFDPYFTTKGPDEGTGLGLAVVHGIIQEHEGYLKVYSEQDKGTRFYIFLPVAEKKEAFNTHKNNKTPLPLGSERIMLVDDEDSIRNSALEFLENLGYELYSFVNGKEAFQEFKKDPYKFDLIITDMTMPVMTGDELACKILKIRPELPVILCSGYCEKKTEDKIKEMGIGLFMPKPLILEELAVMIRDILDGKQKSGIVA